MAATAGTRMSLHRSNWQCHSGGLFSTLLSRSRHFFAQRRRWQQRRLLSTQMAFLSLTTQNHMFCLQWAGVKGDISRCLQQRIQVKRHLATTATVDYLEMRASHQAQIEALPEWQASTALSKYLQQKSEVPSHSSSDKALSSSSAFSFWNKQILMNSILSTFCLHVESRIAALMGQGFYTIGPCGEETLAAAALALQPQDYMALHYRHLSVQIARQLLSLSSSSTDENNARTTCLDFLVKDILLDRARGYAVSSLDPVTGGVHCSIGSHDPKHDFVVTSTLASQCSPAVGRALATAFVGLGDEQPQTPSSRHRPVSFVTLGDGSLHHAHFWSAFHLARHARHKRIKCPVVFGISDNGLSISYNTKGYVRTLFGNDPLIPLFNANGNDLHDVHLKTMQAFDYARDYSAPSVIVYHQLQRRFGHAATDRQVAYLTEKEIQARAGSTLLQEALTALVDDKELTFAAMHQQLISIQSWTTQAFALAATEPKVTRQDMLQRMSVPSVKKTSYVVETTPDKKGNGKSDKRQPTNVMRKHMTRAYAELLEQDKSVAYLGEDVRHGGYYLVTEGLAQQFSKRVIDFPPDETSLLGAALGLSQAGCGVIPIVEIPYAKYLDCAADMMAEVAVLPWLTNSARNDDTQDEPGGVDDTNAKSGKKRWGGGMLIRLQGFDRGLFGGNFHTHNSLYNVLLPGVDVLCYSNGHDYVRGLRHAMKQIRDHGRTVVLVDCTHLLNLRHLHTPGDRQWETPYPEDEDDSKGFDFDTIQIYRGSAAIGKTANGNGLTGGPSKKLALVSYGNGVVTCLQAQTQILSSQSIQVDVLDCPCLNRVPKGLLEALPQYDFVVFADICKQGPGSVFASMVVENSLQRALKQWKVVAAPRTYNPLGSWETFLNVEDVVESANCLLEKINT